MCGLFGMFGPGIQKPDVNVMEQLGLVSQLRGMHGTGVVTDGWMSRYSCIKQPDDFNFTLFNNATMCGTPQDYLVMGHVRHATVGDIKESNTHPFEYKTFVGAHNGTLLVDEFTEDKNKTDSEQMFDAVNDLVQAGWKLKDALLNVLSRLSNKCAYAITVWDREAKMLHIARNENRPFHFAFNSKRSVVYYASERNMLKFVLDRCGVDYISIDGMSSGKVQSCIPSSKTVDVNKEIWYIEKLPVRKNIGYNRGKKNKDQKGYKKTKRERRNWGKDFKTGFTKGKVPQTNVEIIEPLGNIPRSNSVIPFSPEEPEPKIRGMSEVTTCVTCDKPMDEVSRREGFCMPVGMNEYIFQCKECNNKDEDFSIPAIPMIH